MMLSHMGIRDAQFRLRIGACECDSRGPFLRQTPRITNRSFARLLVARMDASLILDP